MKKIAIFISGRLVRYEVCLLPFLDSINHDIDLFISINDDDSEYYTVAKNNLKKYLRKSYIKKFIFPENFNHNPINFPAYTLIDGKYRPYTQLSMYFNDYNAYNMIQEYSLENNINYDIIMKYRSDIINTTFPDLNEFNLNVLYCAIPPCLFTSIGIYKVTIVPDQWIWSSPKIMKIYCNTYNYVMEKLLELNGNYYIGGEDCITDNCYANSLDLSYINIPYTLDYYRQMYDLNIDLYANNCGNGVYKISRNMVLINELLDKNMIFSTPQINIRLDARPS